MRRTMQQTTVARHVPLSPGFRSEPYRINASKQNVSSSAASQPAGDGRVVNMGINASLRFALMSQSAFSELRMNSAAEDIDRAAVREIGGVADKLVIGGDR